MNKIKIKIKIKKERELSPSGCKIVVYLTFNFLVCNMATRGRCSHTCEETGRGAVYTCCQHGCAALASLLPLST
jgi:hypothetical protein